VNRVGIEMGIVGLDGEGGGVGIGVGVGRRVEGYQRPRQEREGLSSWSSWHQARIWGEHCDQSGQGKCGLVGVEFRLLESLSALALGVLRAS
jgi:hypothetical protein